ncbi:hypothetical protein HD553DRAFT_275432 [Filobasidium floriforme]|uniref:uncharacterized protein n=1 Tax=Filobasidium floriforme TaxID=5210 RepID=UPI001E8EA471|nr:uncharacterized protein HD553DRAFT_275432 [Filobasidium floriforme]KAH8081181.1 hypothetical protein HD553DRAFT_275432 [Filobasidium floriforme]
MAMDKELYWKLQNLEDHPDAIPEARTRLMDLLDQTISEATTRPKGTIVDMPTYDRQNLRDFLSTAHKSSASRYEAYIKRRKAGGPREMFPTREYAQEWVKLAAVVKYVDGGWLGGVLDIGSGKNKGLGGQGGGKLERMVGKMAWQVISEEFGDGDLEKNHVYVYEQLLDQLHLGGKTEDGHTRPGYMRDFDGLAKDQGVPRCWTAAIAQQCIGLLASTRDFFPEAIGFNMAYESLPYHLLVTTRELRELKINDYYFALHVSIDNADSGHAALARLAVERYLEGVRERDGEAAMQYMWKRVQAGYTLAEGLPTTPSGPVNFEQVKREEDGSTRWRAVTSSKVVPAPTPIEDKVAALMIRKSEAAAKMHCPSRMTIKGQTIEQWLEPSTLTSEKALMFIRALGEKKPWVKAGDAAGSKLIKELEWGGRMFGAFSRAETELMREWVRKMADEEEEVVTAGAYRDFVGEYKSQAGAQADSASVFGKSLDELVSTDLSVNPADIVRGWNVKDIAGDDLETLFTRPIPATTTSPRMDNLLPLWFLSTSLLEHFPLSPTKFATPLGMTVLRLLRSQLGFGALHHQQDICAGIDDVKSEHEQGDMVGLWELGEKLHLARGEGSRPMGDITDLRVQTEPALEAFCAELMELRTRPYANESVLLGLTLGFARALHGTGSMSSLLQHEDDRATLNRIVEEEQEAILDHVRRRRRESIRDDDSWIIGFGKGYERAVRAVQDHA